MNPSSASPSGYHQTPRPPAASTLIASGTPAGGNRSDTTQVELSQRKKSSASIGSPRHTSEIWESSSFAICRPLIDEECRKEGGKRSASEKSPLCITARSTHENPIAGSGALP